MMLPTYHWHVYKLDTGEFTGRSFGGPSLESVRGNIGPGEGAIEGVTDWRTQRVEGGQLIEHRPPQPSIHHQWNARERAWWLTPEHAARLQRQFEILARLSELDAKMQRSRDELQVNPEDATALQYHSTFNAEKDSLRTELRGLREMM